MHEDVPGGLRQKSTAVFSMISTVRTLFDASTALTTESLAQTIAQTYTPLFQNEPDNEHRKTFLRFPSRSSRIPTPF